MPSRSDHCQAMVPGVPACQMNKRGRLFYDRFRATEVHFSNLPLVRKERHLVLLAGSKLAPGEAAMSHPLAALRDQVWSRLSDGCLSRGLRPATPCDTRA